MDENCLAELMKQADFGRKTWISLVETYHIDYETIVYIMPHCDAELNGYAMKHFRQVLAQRKAKRLLVITCEEIWKMLAADEFTGETILISEDEMTALMKYNDMGVFSSQSIIVSFQYGSDNSLEALIDYHGITREELVCIGVLGLIEYEG